jgi:hypothetical protein
MLTVVLAVAVVGIALLAAAVVLDNTIIALAAIALAVAGLILLGRDWLANRRDAQSEADPRAQPEIIDDPEHLRGGEHLAPDEFEPDVPYEVADAPPDGDGDDRKTA